MRFFAFFFTAPLFFTDVWGYSVLAAGFALALHQGSSAVSGMPLGRLAERVGVGRVVGWGGMVTAATFGWMVLFVSDKPSFAVVILPAFLLGGVGAMANGAFSTSLALREIGHDTLARASSGYYVTRRLASGMGVVAGATILGDTSAPPDANAFRWVWIFVAACYLLSGLAAFADRPTQAGELT